jgi:hypothetical protein
MGNKQNSCSKQLCSIHALIQPNGIVNIPTITQVNILHNSIQGTANETHEPLVTLTTLFKNFFSFVCFTVQWPYHSTSKLQIATIMM